MMNIKKLKIKVNYLTLYFLLILFLCGYIKNALIIFGIVIFHELAHLIERNHNDKFKQIMDCYCPKWEEYNVSINELLNSNKID